MSASRSSIPWNKEDNFIVETFKKRLTKGLDQCLIYVYVASLRIINLAVIGCYLVEILVIFYCFLCNVLQLQVHCRCMASLDR